MPAATSASVLRSASPPTVPPAPAPALSVPSPSDSAPDQHRPVTRVPRSAVRRRVLDAAAAEFVERGYADSSMATIARRAGFTKGAVYSNFDSKQSLLADVLLERAADAIRVSLDRLTDGGTAGGTLAVRAARVLADQLRDERQWFVLSAELAGQAARDPEARAAYQRYRTAQRAALAASLRQNAPMLGLPADAALDRAAIALLAVLSGLAMELAASPDTLRVDDLVAILARVLTGLIDDRAAEERS